MPRGRSKGISIQQRDLDILIGLGTASCLTSKSIRGRWFPEDKTGEATRRRLKRFAEHQLIQSISLAVSQINRVGRMPQVHRLLAYGADIVEDATGMRPPRIAKSDPPKPHALLHRAGMGHIVLEFNAACQLNELPEPQWLLEYDAATNVPLNAPLSQRYLIRWDVPINDTQTATCWPDALCQFTLPGKDRTWNLAIAWEYDRSTETHNQLAGKLDAYEGWLKHKAYRGVFPNADDARVFFVVPSAERLRNTIRAIKDHPAAATVRLAVAPECDSTRVLNAPIWHQIDRDRRAILMGSQ
ncbi:MAG: replication-relaxation family protein [Planctomycetaceae bacterium]